MMKTFQAIRSGFSRAAGAWKGILITWIVYLMLAMMVAVPLKAILRTGFGSSMISERFLKGIDIETLSDMGQVFKGFIRAFGSGILVLFLVSFIANAFLTGGLFEKVNNSVKYRSYWQSCAANFWSFLLIQVFMSLIILFVHMTITGLPAIVMSFSDLNSEKTVFLVVLISSIVFFLVLPVFIMVADYARVWLVTESNTGFFRALSFGFRHTFRNFVSSWTTMILLLLVQALFVLLCIFILPGIFPKTGGGIFMLLILSQLLFIVRIFLRVFRYGSITTLMEFNFTENLAAEKSSSGIYMSDDHQKDFL